MELAAFYIDRRDFKDADHILSKIKEKNLEDDDKPRLHVMKSHVLAAIGRAKQAEKYFKKVIKNVSLRTLSERYLLTMSETLKKREREKYEHKILETLAKRHPFTRSGTKALGKLETYAQDKKSPYYFPMTLMRIMKLHSSLDETLQNDLPEYLDVPVRRNRNLEAKIF